MKEKLKVRLAEIQKNDLGKNKSIEQCIP